MEEEKICPECGKEMREDHSCKKQEAEAEGEKMACPDCSAMNAKDAATCASCNASLKSDDSEEEVARTNSNDENKVVEKTEDEEELKEDIEFEVAYISEAKEAKLTEEMQILEAGQSGKDWKVVMIAPGVSKNKTYYSPSMLSKRVELFEGALCFADHDNENPGSRSVKDVIGWYDQVKYEAGTGITGTFHALESRNWFTDMMKEAYSRGKKDLFGFSINGTGSKRVGKVNGETVHVVEDLHKIDSVDAVINPSAGGRIMRLVASENNSDKEELVLLDNMTIEELKVARPDLFDQIANLSVTEQEAKIKELEDQMAKVKEEEVIEETKVVIEDTKVAEDKNDEIAKLEESVKAKIASLEEMTAKAEEKAKIAECKSILSVALAESELPAPVKKKIEKRYVGKIFDEAVLTEDINDEKEVYAALVEEAPYTRTADANISVGTGQKDRAIKALDGFWDNTAVDGVAPARSLMEAFSIFTGKNSWETDAYSFMRESTNTGYDSNGRVSEALSGAVGDISALVAPGNWAQVLGDSVTRRMLKEYGDLGYDEWRKFSTVETLADFRTQRRTRFGGYGLLPTVGEAASYLAQTSPTDEEATYTPAKRGGLESVTLEMIARDDLASIRRVPFKLARAAKITLYRFVFDMISLTAPGSGAETTYDTRFLFVTSHNNTLVTAVIQADAALNDANLTLAKQKMAKQAAYNESTHILGIEPKYLITTIDNQQTAQRLLGNDYTFSGPAAPSGASYSQSDINVHKGSLELIVVPYWNDDDDGRTDRWVLAASPGEIPTIEIGFFQGKQAPEVFTQDAETVGNMFSNDQLTWKIRHIYGGTPLDHRGFVASNGKDN